MKKAVQIVTIPINKEGWNVNELVLDSIGLCLAEHDYYEGCPKWQTQQLLVLSDAEIQEGDCAYYDTGNIQPCNSALWGKKDAARCELDRKAYGDCKKIIASYPNIPSTLKLSTKMIQKWIDNNAPEETNVEIIKDCQGWGGRGCQSLCSCPLKYKVEEFPYSGDAYPKDNLLLEFNKEITDEDISNAAKKLGQTIEDIRSGYLSVEKAKPSIPTDEEIREKALSALKKEREVDDGEQLSAFEGRCLTTGFYQGYKQALKDLGHE
jgi:hypothetical protein